MTTDLQRLLQENKLRVTVPRMAVFDLLAASNQPLTTASIVRSCSGVDKVSVYRTIALFVRLQIVHIVPHGWKQYYELAMPFKPHHHHLVCTECGHSTELNSPTLEALTARISARHAFAPTRHHFEIFGTCQICMIASSKNLLR